MKVTQGMVAFQPINIKLESRNEAYALLQGILGYRMHSKFDLNYAANMKILDDLFAEIRNFS